MTIGRLKLGCQLWLYCLISLHFVITNSAQKGICDIPEKNVSFSSLSLQYYEGFEGTGSTTTKIYLSLCQPLGNISNICDPKAHSCLTKLVNGVEEEYIPNAGSHSVEGLAPYLDHYKIIYESGDECKNDPRRNVSTRIDFFCTYPDAEDNSILYGGILGECDHQVFWHSSLTCDSGQHKEPIASSCVIKVPGYDAIIDLKVWSNPAGFYLARSADGSGETSYYHINVCKSVGGSSPCPDNSVVCQVDDTQLKVIRTFANFTDTNNLSYNQENEVIRLKYPKPDPKSPSVNINIECDRDAIEPQVTMEHVDDNVISFRFLTLSACLVPPVQCQARNSNQDVYDLSSLRIEEWEVSPGNEKETRYEIKVCGSLPVTQGNPCSGQAGICRFKYEGNTTKMIDATNLGIMYKRPEVLENGDIRLEYSHGDLYKNDRGDSCNMSAEIILRCDDKEYGPRFEDATACRHSLTWNTPAACPQKQVTSTDCTVREPLFNNLFNLTDAHNSTGDYIIKGQNNNYNLNVCGSLVGTCTDSADSTCLDTSQSLTYMDGFLELKYESKVCPSNPNKTLDARVIFTCNHEVGIGSPELVAEEDCVVEFNWVSILACPPHYMVQCSVPTSNGFVDLSSLSLPHENYQVELDSGDIFVLNLCRSLVHTNTTKCPYKSAACLVKPDDVIGQNLGQVHSSLKVDSDGVPYITYTLGSVCPDKKSTLTHLQTRIKFECAPGVYDSRPEFMEISNCHYMFMWKHAVACPVKTTTGNCSVTSQESGFTFNLTSLNRPDGWRWNETAHHVINHLDFNICGPLANSGCGAGVGVCDNNKENFGLANSNLTFTDGKLELVYPGGKCPTKDGKPAETRIRFNCPPRRMGSSGNYEHDGPWMFSSRQTEDMCTMYIDFYTDLACDHQVFCDVTMDNVVYPLTKLRRHDINYKMFDANGSHDFVLNICGPLVPTDVPSSGCNPQGACGHINDRYVGLGKVQNSPTVSNGQLIIKYTEGDYCENNKGTWSSTIFFTCDPAINKNSRFGTPKFIGIDENKCEAKFQMNSLLACKNITQFTKIKEPDSCNLYHSGKNKYIDLTPLTREENYKIYPLPNHPEEYYEMQPCGRLVSSCNSSICRVIPGTPAVSLGNMNDVKYYPDTDELRVRYLDGFECNSHTRNNKFITKIFYSCDPSVDGPGKPTMIQGGDLDCFLLVDWKSRALCDPYEIEQYEKFKTTTPKIPDTIPIDHDDDDFVIHPGDNDDIINNDEKTNKEEASDTSGAGSSWGYVVAVVLLMCLGVYVYKSEKAKDNFSRIITEVRARMPVFLGGRAHRDSTFLISGYNVPGSGFHPDEDDIYS